MTKSRAFLLGLLALTLAPLARAEKLVPAYDPALHVRPPTMKSLDGSTGELMFDAEVVEAARRYRAEHPPSLLEAPGDITAMGELIVVQGKAGETLVPLGSGWGVDMAGIQAVAKKVIERFGDNFQAITLWLTFNDQTNLDAEAYEVPVRNEVSGLGNLAIRDASGLYGSNGVLRSVLNMKLVGARSMETKEAWTRALETWGQENGHRWMMFMDVRDPRSGRISDMLRGRQCAHYSRFVQTQASVQDGFAWQDNGDGSFTWTETSKRYGDLDLYAMGLMAPDEVAPFFFIDNVAGYTAPPGCQNYNYQITTPRTVRGTRVNLTIEDIIAANGPRKVPSDERQDYWREAQVILTAPDDLASSPSFSALVKRLDKGRGFWEAWNREASRNRLVVCTQASVDCGDPRSDVGALSFNVAGKGPQSGPLNLDVQVLNGGKRATTGVKVTIEAKVGDAEPKIETKELGMIPAESERTQTFQLDLKGVECGTEIAVKTSTQSDFHFHRGGASFLLGAQDKFPNDFEEDGDWTVNPDGDDTKLGATWERGTPQISAIRRTEVQPARAHGGTGAWVTGLSATPPPDRATLVREGKATLQSPVYETKGLLDPMLRYWVSFAGAVDNGTGLDPSELSTLVVEARATDGSMSGPWLEIDRLAKEISPVWAQRSVPLPREVLNKSRVQLRFVANDANPSGGGVEAAIDDVVITSNLPACYEKAPPGGGGGGGSGGCNCRFGGRESSSGAFLVLLAALLLRRRR